MRVLFLGEIVGKAGRFTVKSKLTDFVTDREVDFVIANANGAAGGFGLGKKHAITLRKRGIAVLTGGENSYNKKDLVEYLPAVPWILRPANLPPMSPGRGWGVYDTPKGPLGVINLLGQFGYTRMNSNNPYTDLPDIAARMRKRTPAIVLNFHSSTTAEKRAMAFHADGLVSAMLGTGTRCLTADAEIFPGGTAAITDTGRTGSRGALYGMESETEMRILLNRVPERSKDGWGDLRMQGVLMDIASSGKAESIETIDLPCGENSSDPNSKSR